MAEIIRCDPGFERCYCTGIDRATVLQVAQERGLFTVDELRQAIGVCGGCGSCRPELRQLLRDEFGTAGAKPTPP
jgi:NAD(P)H-nitrite reductase large subunit